MNAPLSDYWTVEYHFNSDSFSVSRFPDYLSHSQKACREGYFFDSVILALHPSHQGASDECAIWQERRNNSPVSVRTRLKELRRYVEGLESMTEGDRE
jgi:hypothetical protein